MTIQDATYFLLNQVRKIYPEGEASEVTDRVMESLTGSNKTERMLYKNTAITDKEESQLKQYTERLMKHEPVQYVLNEAWFCRMKFYVDRNVLIPRPETEEMVEWVVREVGSQRSEAGGNESAIRILDIGTGSGCIPVALKRKLNNAEVWSCDVSEAALLVAKKNAEDSGADINFLLLDFLDIEARHKLPLFDIIVSNPPYVPQKDKKEMAANVLDYEPHTALFVPDNDALVFYRAIADFAKGHLASGGSIYAEIHESSGSSVSDLFKSYGFKTEIKKDIQGKERMIKAIRY